MDESELRKVVLLPLFEAMGFRDVRLYHGGSTELGKDIVMWKPGDLAERVNYAVVAKAGRVTGKVTGKSGVSEVTTQVQQSFGSSYADPITGVQQRVNRCWVVSSAEIGKEARDAINAVLGPTNLDNLVSYVDGDRLWALLEEHLPTSLVVAKLAEASRIIESASEHHRLVATLKNGAVHFSVEAKHPAADSLEPLTISGRILLPDSDTGHQLRDALDAHLKTGAPVTIEGASIDGLSVPPVLEPYLQKVDRVMIGPRVSPEPLLVRLEMHSDSGKVASWDYIHLVSEQIGSEEMTFSNRGQPIPWNVTLVIKKDGRGTIKVAANLSGANIKREVEGIRFLEAFSEGGNLHIENLENGLSIGNLRIASGSVPTPDSRWVRLLEQAASIQARTGVLLRIPPRDLTEEDAKEIARVSTILQDGRVELGNAGMLTLTLRREKIPEFQKVIQDGGPLLAEMTGEETATVLGTDVPLGAVRTRMVGLLAHEEAVKELESATQSGADEVTLNVRLKDGGRTTQEYPKWMPGAEVDPVK